VFFNYAHRGPLLTSGEVKRCMQSRHQLNQHLLIEDVSAQYFEFAAGAFNELKKGAELVLFESFIIVKFVEKKDGGLLQEMVLKEMKHACCG